MNLRIALLQLSPCALDLEAARRKGEDFCRQAAAMGADIALFPEMWSAGYSLPDPDDPPAVQAWTGAAVDAAHPFYTHFQTLAAELGLAIALTYLERWPGAPRNTLTLFDRTGAPVLTYAKVHTCAFDRECLLTPGDAFHTAALHTAAGPVRVGAMICYDREFPESARVLALQGAEIILVPNACEMERNRTGQLRARAFENMVGIALANYASPADKGHSMAFDNMAFTPAGLSRDMRIIEAGESEGIYLADFDLDALRAYRAREMWGEKFRRPTTYGPIVNVDGQH